VNSLCEDERRRPSNVVPDLDRALQVSQGATQPGKRVIREPCIVLCAFSQVAAKAVAYGRVIRILHPPAQRLRLGIYLDPTVTERLVQYYSVTYTRRASLLTMHFDDKAKVTERQKDGSDVRHPVRLLRHLDYLAQSETTIH